MKRVIKGNTIAPYSPAVIFDERMVFVSGQIPTISKKGDSPHSFEEQAKSALDNLKNVLEKAGSSLDTVLKVTVYLTSMNNFTVFNDIYKLYFTQDAPSRAAVGVQELPLGVDVEIEAIAYINK
ncbi:MAG: RidA family protein [Candidatus Margulisbacteria bacterium]|nr:RidA family protein [Candidatus Margulisiibacteriota bacterium]